MTTRNNAKIKDFFKPFARPKRPLSQDAQENEDPPNNDSPSLPTLKVSKPHVLLPPSPSRPRKAVFTDRDRKERNGSPLFSSSPLSELSDRPSDLLSDDFQSRLGTQRSGHGSGSVGGGDTSDTSPETVIPRASGRDGNDKYGEARDKDKAKKGGEGDGDGSDAVNVIKASDDDDTSSQASLVDLQELLKGFQKKDTPAAAAPVVGDEEEDDDHDHDDNIRLDPSSVVKRKVKKKNKLQSQSRSQSTQTTFAKGGSQLHLSGRPGSVTRPPKHAVSLDQLLQDAQRDDADEIGVIKVKSMFDAGVEQQLQRQRRQQRKGDGGSEQLLKTVIDEDDETGLRRIVDAVKRTDALDQDKTWWFFGEPVPPAPFVDEEHDFPDECIGWELWHNILIETDARRRFFLSGMMAEKAMAGKLPDDLIQWICRRVPVERRENLRYSYITTIHNLPAQAISDLIDTSLIDDLFSMMGATPEAVEVSTTIEPQIQSASERPTRSWGRLIAVLDLLRGFASSLNESVHHHVLLLLFRLSIDADLSTHSKACRILEDTITTYISSVLDFKAERYLLSISQTLHTTIQNPCLQKLLIRHLLPTTSRISILRIRLSLSYFFSNRTFLSLPLPRLLSIRTLSTHLRRLRLVLDDQTDYVDLSALAYLLDAGIDRGAHTVLSSSSSSSTPWTRDEMKTFDEDVDQVADMIKAMFSGMADSGASHLRRSEAKESLEQVYYRLVYAVRFRGRKKMDIFGLGTGREEEEQQVVKGKGFMEKFLARRGNGGGDGGGGADPDVN